MKKYYYIIILLLLALPYVRAEEWTMPNSNITLTYEITGDPATVTITGCMRYSTGDLVLPSELNGVPVTSIADDAFLYCTGIESITIPATINSLGSNVFSYCNSLSAINVDKANTKYNSLNGVLFNEKFSEIIKYPSAKMENHYSIPLLVNKISEGAFIGCYNLMTIEIPNKVIRIGRRAFRDCINLSNIIIPDKVTRIGDEVFSYCVNLKMVYFLGDAPNLGDSAFYYTDTDFKIYYNPAASGYSTPLWEGYPCQADKTYVFGGGWSWNELFGYFYTEYDPFIYALSAQEWIYITKRKFVADSFFFWRFEASHWGWTEPSLFPLYYSYASNEWVSTIE